MAAEASTKKYENAILYLCSALGGDLKGKVKLAKLLYYIDFDRYEYKESCTSITGDEYERKPMGPVPACFEKVVSKLEDQGALEHCFEENPWANDTEVYKAVRKPDMSVFDDDDKFILDRVIRKYGSLDGTQLKKLTHEEAPYIATEEREKIIYGLAFYRGTDFTDALAA